MCESLDSTSRSQQAVAGRISRAGPGLLSFAMNRKTLGQVAYDTYFAYSKGKSLISGAPLPTFEAQSVVVRGAWEEAARAVAADLQGSEDIIRWWLNGTEAAVIDRIGERLALSRQAVLRQALRTYQLIFEGTHELKEINPQPKLADTRDVPRP